MERSECYRSHISELGEWRWRTLGWGWLDRKSVPGRIEMHGSHAPAFTADDGTMLEVNGGKGLAFSTADCPLAIGMVP